MASRYSGARWRPLASKQTQPRMTQHAIVCLHTMVGSLFGTDGMFKERGWGGTESHYGVGGKWGADAERDLDGEIYQWQDRAFTADANFQGNPRVISIETADNAPKQPRDVQSWTANQLDSIVDLVAWECSLEAHQDCPSSWTCHKGVMWEGVRVAIPPVLIPDTKSTRRGIGLHRQGVEPSAGVGKLAGYLIVGGERWSTSVGKECPTDRRVKQTKEIVIPRVQARLRKKADPVKPAPPKPPKVEDDVTEAQLEAAIIKVLTTAEIIPNKPTKAQLKKDPTLKVSFYTVVGALSNVELDQDEDRDTDAGAVIEVKAMLAALLAHSSVPLPENVKL